MKVIAFYLPQFHCIPENDAWWGDGFTEWVNVKKAKPIYDGHYQPRIPLNNNYYNLLDQTVMEWQVSLAKQYGVYGFCFYHYWFNGKLLLERPVEQYLRDRDLDLPFCLCWANENWTNGWAALNAKILIGQDEGTKEKWKEHFDYLLPFFKDKRYIYKDGKPLLVIYKPDLFPHIYDMIKFWDSLARKEGFDGLTFASQMMPENIENSEFDYHIEYQPTLTYVDMAKTKNKFIRHSKNKIKKIADKFLNIDLEGMRRQKLLKYDYEDVWNCILNKSVSNKKMIPGAFVGWDNTPRKRERGYVVEGATPDKFQLFFSKQIINARESYHQDMIFLFAWNEWAEGGYLEPDEKYEYGYLQAIRDALIENNELEF